MLLTALACLAGLAMTSTSYTDPSGLDPSTTSTAADQVRLGTAAMEVPAQAASGCVLIAGWHKAGARETLDGALGHRGR